VARPEPGVNGAVPGLDGMRPDLEHDPRDPFKGNVTAVLAELEPAWREYRIGYDGSPWTAEPRAGGATLKALSPDDLIAAMREAS
jgi:hypothetical protein